MRYCPKCFHEVESGSEVCPFCGGNLNAECPPHHIRPGTLLNGKYIVGQAIGEGGFGITYLGKDTVLEMKVAIKEFYPAGITSRDHSLTNQVSMSTAHTGLDAEKEMARFLDEARTLAKFSSEQGVVNVLNFFQENGTAYIVMEYVSGITLKEYLHRKGTMSPNVIFKAMDPIFVSLAKIHAQGLIHRDISPDNIMIQKDGRFKLLDFGAARSVSEDRSMSVILKRGYAPEEQYRAKGHQGPWTDVYALCGTIYRAITGIVPEESLERLYNDELKKPSELGVIIDSQLEEALMKGLAVHAEDRIQSIPELRKLLASRPQNVPAKAPDEDMTIRENEDPVREVRRRTVKPVPAPHANPTAQAVSRTSSPAVAVESQTQNQTIYEAHRETPKPKQHKTYAKKKNKTLPILCVAIVVLLCVIGIAATGLFRSFVPAKTSVQDNTIQETGIEETNIQDSDTLGSTYPRRGSISQIPLKIYLNSYHVPMQYTELSELGWESDGVDENLTMEPMTSGAMTLRDKYDHCIFVIVANHSNSVQRVKDCDITTISLSFEGTTEEYRRGLNKYVYTLAGLVNIASSRFEVIQALGRPDEEHEVLAYYEPLAYYFDDGYLMVYINNDNTTRYPMNTFTIGYNDNTVTNIGELPLRSNTSETSLELSPLPSLATHVHFWNPATCLEPATCADCGETKGTLGEHNWMTSVGNSTPVCATCGLTAQTSNISVGETISFGTYEQDNNGANGKEDIQWQVLAVEGQRALLISRYALDAYPYNDKRVDTTWETSTLRWWLNNTFMNDAFRADESQAIIKTQVDNSSSQCYSSYRTSGGSNTEDYVFALSYYEAQHYFPNESSRVCANTPYAAARAKAQISDSYNSSVRNCCWWLRSPGDAQSNGIIVFSDGKCQLDIVNNASGCVRPAIWVNVNSPALIPVTNVLGQTQLPSIATSAAPTSSPVPAYIVCSNTVNIRSGAGVGNALVTTLPNGTAVNIYEQTTVMDKGWARIDQGWVCMDYVQLGTPNGVSSTGTSSNVGIVSPNTTIIPADSGYFTSAETDQSQQFATVQNKSQTVNGFRSNSISQLSMRIKQSEYHVPMQYAEFTSCGWKSNGYDENYELQPMNSAGMELQNENGDSIWVTVANRSTTAHKVKECNVVSIWLSFEAGTDEYRKNLNDNDYVLTSRINISSSKDEMLQSFGQPDQEDLRWEPDETYYYYCADGYILIRINTDRAAHYSKNGFGLSCFPEDSILDIGFVPQVGESEKTAVPHIGSVSQISMEMSGIDYHVPMQYAELTNLGWEVDGYDENFEMQPGTCALISFRNATIDSLFVTVENRSQIVQKVKDCEITSISIDFEGTPEDHQRAVNDNDYKLAGLLNLWASKDEVLQVFGVPTSIETGWLTLETLRYDYADGYVSVKINSNRSDMYSKNAYGIFFGKVDESPRVWVPRPYNTVKGFVVNADEGLNVRETPSTSANIVKRLYNGDPVTVYEQVNQNGVYWGHIEDGWICMDYFFESFIQYDGSEDVFASSNLTVRMREFPSDLLIGNDADGTDYSQLPFWGQNTYDRKSVESIVFTTSLDVLPENCWDVSEKQDNSIQAGMKGGTLIVASDRPIKFNPNSSYLFAGFSNLQSIDFGTNVGSSEVTNMAYMFGECKNLTSLDLSWMDTSKVTDMSGVFAGCSKLQKLDLSAFNTKQVNDMTELFWKCESLYELNTSRMDTGNVTKMCRMFFECSNLRTLDLANFNTSNVTDMTAMFNGCSSLSSVNLTSFSTDRVAYFSGMFSGCRALTSLNLSSFRTSRAESMGWMFSGCHSLTSLNLSHFETGRVTVMQKMFAYCDSLSFLDISGFTTTSTITIADMFVDCHSLSDLRCSNDEIRLVYGNR